MTHGEVWWVEFGPAAGGEIQKRRPAIIVSNNAANKHLNRVQIVPTTGQTSRLYPSEAFVSVGGKRSKAMADHLTTVSKQRLKVRIGMLSVAELQSVERVIRLQLGL